MTLVAGCYERFLFGFRFSSEEDRALLSKVFSHAAHQGPVKCVDSSGSFIASGGNDDTIHVYNLRGDKDMGMVLSPCDGAVTCLKLFTPSTAASPSHLFTGSADGGITVFKATGAWSVLKVMRGHDAAVNGLAVHNTGMVALTVSRDMNLRMWNLKKGKCTYHSKLEIEADSVEFNETGQLYSLQCGTLVAVHNVEDTGGKVATLQHDSKVLSSCWLGPDAIITGGEDRCIRLFDTRSPDKPQLVLSEAHQSRIKGLTVMAHDQQPATPRQLLGSCSSDGVVRVWDIRNGSNSSALSECSTGARLTCLTSWSSHSAAQRTAGEPALHQKQRTKARVQTNLTPDKEDDGRQTSSERLVVKTKRKSVPGGPESVERNKKHAAAEGAGSMKGGKQVASAEKQSGVAGNKAKPRGKAGKGGDDVVVKDGVVEFIDRKSKKGGKSKATKKKRGSLR